MHKICWPTQENQRTKTLKKNQNVQFVIKIIQQTSKNVRHYTENCSQTFSLKQCHKIKSTNIIYFQRKSPNNNGKVIPKSNASDINRIHRQSETQTYFKLPFYCRTTSKSTKNWAKLKLLWASSIHSNQKYRYNIIERNTSQ